MKIIITLFKLFLFLLAFIVAAFFLFLFLVLYKPDPLTWDEKITITIETPQGEVSGHSVQLAGISAGNLLDDSRAFLKGEAVFVKLPHSRQPNTLFALLGRKGMIHSFYRSEDPERAAAIGSKHYGPLTLLRDKYPTLVTFDDINDPASVKEVDPNDLAATFGEGYSLKSITLEITDEPVTEGEIDKVLGWWCEYRGEYLVQRYGGQVSNDFARNIGSSHFRIGECTK